MRLYLYCALLLSCSTLFCLDATLPGSPLIMACQGVSLAAQEPASLLSIAAPCQPGVQTAYLRHYSLADLPRYSVAGAIHRGHVLVGAGCQLLDHPLYIESAASVLLAYDHGLLRPALVLRWMHSGAKGYQDDTTLQLDAGVQGALKSFTWLVSVSNLTQASHLDEPLPMRINWEAAYQITPLGMLAVALEKEAGFDFSFRLASRYQLHPMLALVAGYQYQPDRLGAGFCCSIRSLDVSYGFRTHQQLDLTHCLGVSYALP